VDSCVFWCIAVFEDAGIVEELLAAGASTEVYDEYGYTPLLNSLIFGHRDVVKTLINGGANVNNSDELVTVNRFSFMI